MSTFTQAQRAQQHNRDGGGRYAQKAHSEAEIDLGDALGDPDLSTAGWMELARRHAARQLAVKKLSAVETYMDADDIAQDVTVALLERAGKANELGPIRYPASFVAHVASNKALQATRPDYSHTDATAQVILRNEVAAKEEELGRELTVAETRDLTEQVRLSFPVEARPRRSYSQPLYQHRSLESEITWRQDADAMAEGWDGVRMEGILRADRLSEPEEWALAREAASMGDLADEELDELASARASGEKRQTVAPGAYNALVRLHGGVSVTPESRPHRTQYLKSTKILLGVGDGDEALGVKRALAQWDRGDGPEESRSVHALFYPFGDHVSVDDQERIVATLRSAGDEDKAAMLWNAAMRCADRRDTKDSPEKLARAWAREHHINVPARGHLKPEVMEAWRDAQAAANSAERA